MCFFFGNGFGDVIEELVILIYEMIISASLYEVEEESSKKRKTLEYSEKGKVSKKLAFPT